MSSVLAVGNGTVVLCGVVLCSRSQLCQASVSEQHGIVPLVSCAILDPVVQGNDRVAELLSVCSFGGIQ